MHLVGDLGVVKGVWQTWEIAVENLHFSFFLNDFHSIEILTLID